MTFHTFFCNKKKAQGQINDGNTLSGWVGELFIRGSGSTFKTRSGLNRSTDEGEIKQNNKKKHKSTTIKKMLESRPEDALVKLVKLVNLVKLVKPWRLY